MLKILTKEEFERRTADGARTPVFREYLADRETPVSVLTRVADAPGDVFLALLISCLDLRSDSAVTAHVLII